MIFYHGSPVGGLNVLKPQTEVSAQEMQFVFNELRKDIEKHDLKSLPKHAMSIFIRNHFPVVWNANDE